MHLSDLVSYTINCLHYAIYKQVIIECSCPLNV